MIEVNEYTLFLGGPIARDRRSNVHLAPNPRVGDVLLIHEIIVSYVLSLRLAEEARK
jgi:hypothetical protein